MLLATDIGNTNIVFGIYNNGKWLNHWRIQTDAKKMADEYEVIFRSLLTGGNKHLPKVEKIILSSVVPSLLHPFIEMLSGLFSGVKITVVSPEIYSKLPIKIINPYEIGTDLVSNSIAAYKKYGDFTMVIDFGTALTFTTIGEKGQIEGVAIAPGLQTAVTALAGKTAQLPQIHLTKPPSVLGKNTIHAIQSGVVCGFAGLADSMIEQTQNELNKTLTVVATGGMSQIIAPLTKNIKHVELLLTLNGLAAISSIIDK